MRERDFQFPFGSYTYRYVYIYTKLCYIAKHLRTHLLANARDLRIVRSGWHFASEQITRAGARKASYAGVTFQ